MPTTWTRGKMAEESQEELSQSEESRLWDSSVRRGIRSEQRRVIRNIHGKICNFRLVSFVHAKFQNNGRAKNSSTNSR